MLSQPPAAQKGHLTPSPGMVTAAGYCLHAWLTCPSKLNHLHSQHLSHLADAASSKRRPEASMLTQ